MKHIVYIHGFNSSPQSEKARLSQAWFKESREFELTVASFPPEPASAIAEIDELVARIGIERIVGFIGSSLGGFYSLYFNARYAKPVVLINPALKPYVLLSDYIGPQVNPYTGHQYIVKSEHMEQLQALDASALCDTEQVFLLTQTGDETLDFTEALGLLPSAQAWIQYGGNHAFIGFEQTLPAIQDFFLRHIV